MHFRPTTARRAETTKHITFGVDAKGRTVDLKKARILKAGPSTSSKLAILLGYLSNPLAMAKSLEPHSGTSGKTAKPSRTNMLQVGSRPKKRTPKNIS